MSGKVAKLFKWSASAARVAKVKVATGAKLNIAKGKPLYLGRGAKIILKKGASCEIGAGVYLSTGCVVKVADGAHVVIEDGVFMNDNCRVTVVKDVHIGEGALFGPNVQIYDHDHIFDQAGVHSELRVCPTGVGKKCWLCSNVVVTRGCSIADRALISANSVVTHDLTEEAALYAGAPACLVKKYE